MTITRSTRGTIVEKLLEMAGLSNLEEASQESKPYRIIRDNRDVEEVITALRSTINPFNAEGTEMLSFTICHRDEQHPIT